MLPVRFVAENLGCEVGWDAKTQTVTITYPK
ncbi:MAG: stalk domain-containing protein [Caldisericia bacterium]